MDTSRYRRKADVEGCVLRKLGAQGRRDALQLETFGSELQLTRQGRRFTAPSAIALILALRFAALGAAPLMLHSTDLLSKETSLPANT